MNLRGSLWYLNVVPISSTSMPVVWEYDVAMSAVYLVKGDSLPSASENSL